MCESRVLEFVDRIQLEPEPTEPLHGNSLGDRLEGYTARKESIAITSLALSGGRDAVREKLIAMAAEAGEDGWSTFRYAVRQFSTDDEFGVRQRLEDVARLWKAREHLAQVDEPPPLPESTEEPRNQQVKALADNQTDVTKSASVNARIIDMWTKKPESKEWSARDYATALACSVSSVADSQAWKTLMEMREAAKQETFEKQTSKDRKGRRRTRTD